MDHEYKSTLEKTHCEVCFFNAFLFENPSYYLDFILVWREHKISFKSFRFSHYAFLMGESKEAVLTMV